MTILAGSCPAQGCARHARALLMKLLGRMGAHVYKELTKTAPCASSRASRPCAVDGSFPRLYLAQAVIMIGRSAALHTEARQDPRSRVYFSLYTVSRYGWGDMGDIGDVAGYIGIQRDTTG